MLSARRGESTDADAMAVQMDRHSSQHGNSSDDDAEEADFSPSLHKKEMLERDFDCDDDDDGAFSDAESEGPPDLASSSGDDEQDDQDRSDFIKESTELFESDADKKSRKRLADFTKGELLQRLMQLEKEEQAQKFRDARPGSVKSFEREHKEEMASRDLLREQSTSRKHLFRAAISPPPRKPSYNSASASDSDMGSTATDSTRSTRKRTNFPWIAVKRFSHKDMKQTEITQLLSHEAARLMDIAGNYISKKSLDTDLGPFKRTHEVCCMSAYSVLRFQFFQFFQFFRHLF